MSKITALVFAASLFSLGLSSSPASALNTRSFISASGADTNPCTRTAPCRTLQNAHDSTSAGGEINMLDPAGYGPVTITKSISIVNDGVGSAGVLVPSGGTGITISAGATDVINLRGVIIEGAGAGDTGIRFNTGKSLTIENCVVRGVTGNGIRFFPTGSSALAVSNSLIASNGFAGINISPSGSGAVTAVLNQVEMLNNVVNGFEIDGGSSTGTINATVTDSVSAGNSPSSAGGAGFLISSTGGAVTKLMLGRSVAANNGVGIWVVGVAATARVGQSIVSGNGNGWFADGFGTLQSYGTNQIDNNGGNETAPPLINNK